MPYNALGASCPATPQQTRYNDRRGLTISGSFLRPPFFLRDLNDLSDLNDLNDSSD